MLGGFDVGGFSEVCEGRAGQTRLFCAEQQQQLAQQRVVLHEQVHCASDEMLGVFDVGVGVFSRSFGRWLVGGMVDALRFRLALACVNLFALGDDAMYSEKRQANADNSIFTTAT